MRELTGKLVVNEDTFAPELALLLDGEDTGIVMEIEPLQDLTAIHGDGVVNSARLLIIADLDKKYSLTTEEREHYIEKFNTLIDPAIRND